MKYKCFKFKLSFVFFHYCLLLTTVIFLKLGPIEDQIPMKTKER